MPLIAAVLTKSAVDGALEVAAGAAVGGADGAGAVGVDGVWANAGHAAIAQTPANKRARLMKNSKGWIGRPGAAAGSMRRIRLRFRAVSKRVRPVNPAAAATP